ncbi:sensor domain-containing diguanylate cyclase [Shewanella youngdeokensis]|uniref:diguanylate cyclase n=1 Tax=Shewanella youngdeokensis TaxID=2999068 RepID=A0ABZ0JVK0_9GAMM|nr:sensor domain-containing diguanylate cyclase [Shewanella sp. DAU334]
MDKFKQNKLLLASVLGFIGLVVNLFPIPLFSNILLILGNASYIISAALLGPVYGLYTALIAVSGLFISMESPHVYVMFSMEAVFLGALRRRGLFTLYASLFFWGLIGMPLFYVYATFFTELPSTHLPFIILKQGINGIIYTGIGSLVVILTPGFWYLKNRSKSKKRLTFNAQLTYAFTLIISLALLFAALLFNNQFVNRHQELLSQNIKESAHQVGALAQAHIDTHIQAINNAASVFSLHNISIEKQQLTLSKLHRMYPGFITMLKTNQQGILTAASPASRLTGSNQPTTNISVESRPYFTESFVNQKNFISPVFLSRSFANDPIIVISAPVYSPQSFHQPIGVLAGSLDLGQFKNIEHKNSQTKAQSIVLVDRKNRVIFGSRELGLSPLSDFNYTQKKNTSISELPTINIRTLDDMSAEFIYARYELDNQWTLYVLNPVRPLVQIVENMYITTFAILLISLLITFFITKVISTRLTLPLEAIASKFSDSNISNNYDDSINEESPKEVYALYLRLKQSKSQLISYQLELEEKVAIRTFELEQANSQLKLLAEKDSLTGLYNRRYAESQFTSIQDSCKRSDEAIAIAIMDLDHFKHINDTYGHLAGDMTLKAVSCLLEQDFKRDADIIVRYGGEEFLVIMPLCNALKIEAHLESFKQKLSQLVILKPGSDIEFNVTTSIGAVIANSSYSNSLEDWIKQADLNLYHAKNNGRNKLVFTTLPDPVRNGETEST